jgi:predicted AlkP superfamily pyrophosphatase or phosphodiesterase
VFVAVAVCLGVWLTSAIGGEAQPAPSRLFAIFVVDGLRPDSINPTDTPTIARLRAEGAEYVNSHSIFPTVTRVNAAALATGAYPVLTGIVGNSMFAEKSMRARRTRTTRTLARGVKCPW